MVPTLFSRGLGDSDPGNIPLSAIALPPPIVLVLVVVLVLGLFMQAIKLDRCLP
jgi:hypothetical protein